MFDFIINNEEIFKFVIGGLFIIVAIILLVLAYRYERRAKFNASPMKKMTALSILTALSVLLYYLIKIKIAFILPFMPPFLEIHFSAVPIYIAGFLFGPLSGAVVAVLRFLAKLPGSETMGVGELADLIIGLLTVVVASFIYHRNKTKKGSIYALSSTIIIWVVVSIITNWLFIVPFYITLYFGGDVSAFTALLSKLPGVENNYMLAYTLYAVIPFNIILSTLTSIVTFLVYKRVSIAYDKIGAFEIVENKNAKIK